MHLRISSGESGIEQRTIAQADESAESVRHFGSGEAWWAALVVTALFAAVQIHQSLRIGALALPTGYDDISYYVDGADLLTKFHEGSVGRVLRSFLTVPPHAPLSAALAFLGFALLGIQHWVGPVANAAVLFFFVRAFFAVAAPLPIGQAVLLAVALLGFPFAGTAIMMFRPDPICALLTAAGTLYIVLRPQWLSSRRDQIVAGLLFGAALWAKPTVFHLTAILFAVAMALASFGALRQRDLRRPIIAGLVTIGVAALVAGSYYAFAFREVVDYIWTVVFGREASIWVQQLPLRHHILYYLTGSVGSTSLGLWLYPGLLLGGVVIWLYWHSGNRDRFTRAILAVVMIVTTYLAVTIPEFKGPFGLAFGAIFFAATALASVALIANLRTPWSWAACIALVLFSGWQFKWPFTIPPAGVPSADYAASRWTMLRDTANAVGNDVAGKMFYQTTPMPYLNWHGLAFEFYSRGWTPPVPRIGDRIADLDEHRREMEKADIVFALTPDVEVFSYLPTASSEFRASILRLLDASPLFQPPVRIPDTVKGGAALVYKAHATGFSPLRDAVGFGPIEGPHPHWNLPRVRWGFGEQSTFVLDGAPESRANLLIRAATVAIPNQTLTVIVNGETKLTANIPHEFIPLQIPIQFNSQGNVSIVFKYGVASGNAVLFKTLLVQQ